MPYDANGLWVAEPTHVSVPIQEFVDTRSLAGFGQKAIEVAQAQAAAQEQYAQRNADANAHALTAVDQRGQHDYGREQWNASMQRFRREETDISGYESMLAASPVKANQKAMHAHTMANDKEYRERFKAASAEGRQAMIAEHARQRSSYGYVSDDPEPATAEAFLQTGGRGFDDDKDWSRAFDQAYRERGSYHPGRRR